MGNLGGKDMQQGSGYRTKGQDGSWQTRWSHIYMWINQEEQLGSKTDDATHGSSAGNKLQNLWL